MKAVVYEKFGGPIGIATIPDPTPHDDGAVIRVQASGICRSDWHGWQGHDPDIATFPHVPGHELAGTVEAVGKAVRNWKPGERVTIPFVSGCGSCPECRSGNQQVCDHQYQPGFSGWGSFAEFVAIRYADTNLVRLPDEVDFVTAASLGCRFGTSFRAVVAQGALRRDEWISIHGCGGVGLSAIMIAAAMGARVIAIDIDDAVLALAASLGAEVVINAASVADVVARIHETTGRGAHVSIDALGSVATCTESILCLRKGGRHVQVGLLVGKDVSPRIPMTAVVANELRILGSHGVQAHKYSELLAMIVDGALDPRRIVGKTVALEDAPAELMGMGKFGNTGITVIDRF